MVAISVVIPTFEDAELAFSAIESCLAQSGVDLEVLVTDDSTSDEVKRAVAIVDDPRVRYMRHQSTGTASDNWNFGISQAAGRYIVLLHHDELFIQPDALSRARNVLNDLPGVYVFGHEVILSAERIRYRKTWMAQCVKAMPSILFFSNFVGSPSNVVFEASQFRPFDARLKWLVDVDWFYRMARRQRITFSDRVEIRSLAFRGMVITKSLNVISIERQEAKLLMSESGGAARRFFLLARLTWRVVKQLVKS